MKKIFLFTYFVWGSCCSFYDVGYYDCNVGYPELEFIFPSDNLNDCERGDDELPPYKVSDFDLVNCLDYQDLNNNIQPALGDSNLGSSNIKLENNCINDTKKTNVATVTQTNTTTQTNSMQVCIKQTSTDQNVAFEKEKSKKSSVKRNEPSVKDDTSCNTKKTKIENDLLSYMKEFYYPKINKDGHIKRMAFKYFDDIFYKILQDSGNDSEKQELFYKSVKIVKETTSENYLNFAKLILRHRYFPSYCTYIFDAICSVYGINYMVARGNFLGVFVKEVFKYSKDSSTLYDKIVSFKDIKILGKGFTYWFLYNHLLYTGYYKAEYFHDALARVLGIVYELYKKSSQDYKSQILKDLCNAWNIKVGNSNSIIGIGNKESMTKEEIRKIVNKMGGNNS